TYCHHHQRHCTAGSLQKKDPSTRSTLWGAHTRLASPHVLPILSHPHTTTTRGTAPVVPSGKRTHQQDRLHGYSAATLSQSIPTRLTPHLPFPPDALHRWFPPEKGPINKIDPLGHTHSSSPPPPIASPHAYPIPPPHLLPPPPPEALHRWFPPEKGPINKIDPIGNSPVIIHKLTQEGPIMPCAALACPLLPSSALSCPLLPSPALACPLLPSSALSCPLLPSPALFCPLLPSPALACPHLGLTRLIWLQVC
ncbi:unnamed protein product, partial [Closterium sp. NIES-53]